MLLASREEDLGEALFSSAAEVGQVRVGLQGAGDHLEIAHTAELVPASAEHEGLHRLVRLDLGRRHQLGDRRHQGPHAEEFRGRAADDWRDLALEDALAQPALDLLFVQRPGVQVLLEQRVVALRGCLDELAAVLVDSLLHIVGDRHLAPLAVVGGHERLQVQQVDNAAELVLGTDRKVQRERPGCQRAAHRGYRAVEVGILFVQLVHDDDAGLVRPVDLLPRDLGADGELRGRPDHDHRAFGRAQAADDLARKVEEAGRVEDVDLVTVVLGKGDAEVDRDLPFLFLGFEVCGRRRLIG